MLSAAGKPKPPRFSLMGMPNDVLLVIMAYLDRSDRLRVLSLCTAWYNLLTSISYLWQSPKLNSPGYAMPAHISHITKYSKDLPLHLSLVVGPRHLGDLEGLAATITGVLERVRSLTIKFIVKIRFIIFERYTYFLTLFTDTSAPCLEHLEISIPNRDRIAYDERDDHDSFSEDEPNIYIPDGLFADDAPNLVSVVMGYRISCVNPIEAFGRVTHLIFRCYKIPDDLRNIFPSLKVLSGCDIKAELFSVDPRIFDGLDTVALSFFESPEEKIDEMALLAHHGGVRHIALTEEFTDPEDMMERNIGLLSIVQTLRITRECYHWGMQAEIWIYSYALIDSTGKCVESIGNYSIKSPSVPNEVVRTLTSLTFCESVILSLDEAICEEELSNLVSLEILVLPTSSRITPNLLHWSKELYDELDDIYQLFVNTENRVFLIVPKLATFRLGVHPPWPRHVNEGYRYGLDTPQDVFDEVHAVYATSVAQFLSRRIRYRSRLREIVLDPKVMFEEGFHSEEANSVRALTDVMRYSLM